MHAEAGNPSSEPILVLRGTDGRRLATQLHPARGSHPAYRFGERNRSAPRRRAELGHRQRGPAAEPQEPEEHACRGEPRDPHHEARHGADARAGEELAPGLRGRWMDVELEDPRAEQHGENGCVRTAQAEHERVARGDAQARARVFDRHGRVEIDRDRLAAHQRHEVARLHEAHAARPDVVVAVAPRLDHEEGEHEERAGQQRGMRRRGRGERERNHRGGDRDRPVRGGVEARAPIGRARHFGPVDMGKRHLADARKLPRGAAKPLGHLRPPVPREDSSRCRPCQPVFARQPGDGDR